MNSTQDSYQSADNFVRRYERLALPAEVRADVVVQLRLTGEISAVVLPATLAAIVFGEAPAGPVMIRAKLGVLPERWTFLVHPDKWPFPDDIDALSVAGVHLGRIGTEIQLPVGTPARWWLRWPSSDRPLPPMSSVTDIILGATGRRAA